MSSNSRIFSSLIRRPTRLIRQLKYFVAVAEELHFGRAAKRLSITQPPLSFNIKRLEESLNFELFRRNTREVALTSAGKVLYVEAVKILAHVEIAERLVGRAVAGESGSVCIGILGSALLTPIPKRVRAFRDTHPDVSIEITELTSVEQYEALLNEEIDLGIVHPRNLPTRTSVSSTQIYSESFMCALHNSHPLAVKRKNIELNDLRDEEFILFPRQSAPAYYEKIVALCVSAGFVPRMRHQVRNMLSMTSLVALNFGIALVPTAISKLPTPGVAYRRLRPVGSDSELHCIWRTDEESPAVLGMLKALRSR